ncbi:MAG: FHA domain-containing protein [Polyangiaceae bacterium]|jgi:hypothetical protein|nr:FHA domain-containing protein [Polyangiaceae bacterium]
MRLLTTENNDRAPARLRVLAGLSAGVEHAFVDEGEVSLGSAPNCSLRFAHADVSALHAVVRALPGGRYEITNRSLVGQLFVNGKRLVGSRTLEGGESINVGGVAFLRFLAPTQARGEAPDGGSDSGPHAPPIVDIAPSLVAAVTASARPVPKLSSLRARRASDRSPPKPDEAPPVSRRREALVAARKVLLSVAAAAGIGVVVGLQYRFVAPLAMWANAARGAAPAPSFEPSAGEFDPLSAPPPSVDVAALRAAAPPALSGSAPSTPGAPLRAGSAAAPLEAGRPAASAATPLEAGRPAASAATSLEAGRSAASAATSLEAGRSAASGAARAVVAPPSSPAGAPSRDASDDASRAQLAARARRGVATQDELRLWLRLCQADNDTSCIAEAHLLLLRAQQEGR